MNIKIQMILLPPPSLVMEQTMRLLLLFRAVGELCSPRTVCVARRCKFLLFIELKVQWTWLVFRSFESCICNTQAYMYAWMYARIYWISRSREQWMKCTFNISLHFVTLCHLRGKNPMRGKVVPCHVLIILFLAGRLYCGGFQTFQTEQILLIIDVWLTFRVYFRCLLFLTGIDLWWIPDISFSRVVFRMLNFHG